MLLHNTTSPCLSAGGYSLHPACTLHGAGAMRVPRCPVSVPITILISPWHSQYSPTQLFLAASSLTARKPRS